MRSIDYSMNIDDGVSACEIPGEGTENDDDDDLIRNPIVISSPRNNFPSSQWQGR